MKKILKKSAAAVMLTAITFQTFAPAMVIAESFEDANEISIGGSPTINGTSFEYQNGTVTISKNGVLQNSTNFALEASDQVVISMTPDAGYEAVLYNNTRGYDMGLVNNSYSFTINNADTETLSFTPSFRQENQNNQGDDDQNQQSQVVTFDFRLNGVDFTNIGSGAQVTVPNDFNMDSITEFYIKKIYIDGTNTYTYADNEYSYNLLDNQGRHIFEINSSKTSDNYAKIRIQSHPSDILNSDLVQDRSNYYEFYIPEINLIKSGFKGVEVTTNVMPDSYDFTTWNGVDLTATTESNPGKVTVYYGENTIDLSNDDIEEITLVPNKGVPASAINIDNSTHKVTVLSNYYNEIPLKVKLNDGTIGYINVNRIGIFIGSLNKGVTEFPHGASADVGENLNVDTDQDRIVAVFYHENTRVGEDYKLIVNATYEDGTTETKIAKFVGDVNNSSGNIIGTDYILWEGTENSPVKVSVTAVDAEALTDENTFGGATFGSGEGVVWERD